MRSRSSTHLVAGTLLAGSLFAVLGTGCPSMSPDAPPAPPPGLPETLPLGLSLVAEGFTSPVALVAPDDGTGRRFVVEQVGLIRIIDANGTVRSTPFLDVSDRLVSLMPNFDERGLLGLAFHPAFAQTGRFFVCYNAPLQPTDPESFNSRWRLSEFTASAGDANAADPGSEVVLLEVLKPQFNHNGGQLAFGPDGMLYASIGDGGGSNDVGTGHDPDTGNGQALDTLLGKILRYDADTPGELRVPADNPFVGDGDALDAIYAYGFRNPWRFSFDLGGSGRLFCADVGQNLYEEVDLVTAGGNYGWHIREGTQCFDPDSADTPPVDCPLTGAGGESLIPPIMEYSQFDAGGNSIGRAVVGGFFYRGSDVPVLAGRYVFGDWSRSFLAPDGSIFVAQEDASGTWEFIEAEVATESSGRIGRYLLAFGQDPGGEIYVLTSSSAGPTGSTGGVFKIVTPP